MTTQHADNEIHRTNARYPLITKYLQRKTPGLKCYIFTQTNTMK